MKKNQFKKLVKEKKITIKKNRDQIWKEKKHIKNEIIKKNLRSDLKQTK